jgi:hypothetical protein
MLSNAASVPFICLHWLILAFFAFALTQHGIT